MLERLELRVGTVEEEACELVLAVRTELTSAEVVELVTSGLDGDPSVPFLI